MLPAAYRLKKTKEIERVWKSGRSFFTPAVQFKVVPNKMEVSRFAVVIGTKTEKTAVRRNLWKRRTREILRTHLPHLQPGFDVIVMAKKPAVTATYQQLAVILEQLLKQTRLIL